MTPPATGKTQPQQVGRLLAQATGLARSVVAAALKRLIGAGIIERTRRLIRERIRDWCALSGRAFWIWRTRQASNAYRVNFPLPDRAQLGDLAQPVRPPATAAKAESGKPTETTPVSNPYDLEKVADPGLRAVLARMVAYRAAREPNSA